MIKNLTESKQILMNRNSSKGNQLKWFDKDIWYKADYLGYEALSEFVISKLLKKTNIPAFVDYDLLKIEYQGKIFNGCSSANFLDHGCELITLEKLFRKYKGIELVKELAGWDVSDKIQYVVDEVKDITGLNEFGKYLTMVLELDTLFLNEDRHTHNIALILDENSEFDYCPIFDNGGSLFSDATISFDLNMPLESCYDVIESKPFHHSFDVQMDAAEELYGNQLKHWFSMKDVENIVHQVSEFYPDEITSRVIETMRMQLRKYRYMEIKEPLENKLQLVLKPKTHTYIKDKEGR